MSRPLVIFTNTKMTHHENSPGHPECPDRLTAIMNMIDSDFPHISVETSYPADEDIILLAHPQSHLDYLLDNAPFDGWSMIDGDTGMNKHSYDCALLSAGTAIQATKAVLDGEAETAFALSRPPGHHAEYDTAMGFCFFNNAFIAAKYSKQRTLIIDFDVHHGNGTEDLVKRHTAQGYNDIAYTSIHQGWIFPGTGLEDSRNICNCPMKAGTGSEEWRNAVSDKIVPFAKQLDPELIIFSAGFDAHKSDPLAQFELNHDDFAWIVEQVKPICPKIVSILEGGYNLETLPLSVKAYLQAFRDF